MIENLSSDPPISELKNDNPELACIEALFAAINSSETPGTGITERNLYTTMSHSVKNIFFLKLLDRNMWVMDFFIE